jgi:isocitrate dehydrogenase kinase/phosphatase
VGGEIQPFVFPILHNEKDSIYVDTVLFYPDDVSKLFSFTRSYFMVDTPVPSQYIAFLKSIMPQKELFELYSAIGFGKHAKTVFYRSAVANTVKTNDQYIIAPGIKGMVMLVFTLPSFDYVYKVIKDRFTPPKDMTREQVKEKYKLVKRSDRAGRMAETQEFNNLAFDRRRFSDELILALEKEVPSLLEEKGNALILRHVYVERRMTPLNLYLKHATQEQLYSVIDEYGNAIKQLAGANIFPGDMLLKNFGVTRHGRVVFYDYDEICPLVDCNFRNIPMARTEEQEMASQPWYDVGPADVFPEEFRLFFSGNRRAREVFDSLHPELYQTDFWIDLQRKLKAGMVEDVFPYRRKYRFERP